MIDASVVAQNKVIWMVKHMLCCSHSLFLQMENGNYGILLAICHQNGNMRN